MASHVFVIDSSARRTQIKTSPGTYLREVLEQACKSKGFDADQYELKQGNKHLDLSRSIRLSGLSSGAKLDLVQASRTPSAVSIALQLPESEGNTRVTDKFPSNTSIWQILRRFESGAAGQGQSTAKKQYNFTQRGVAQVENGASGAGRMCYETPVIFVLGRELGTLADLQKTLAQLGLNKGNSLLRLSFKNTQQPIEQAMAEISHFFKDDQQSDSMDVDTFNVAAQLQPQPQPTQQPESGSNTELFTNIQPATSKIPSEPTPLEIPTTTGLPADKPSTPSEPTHPATSPLPNSANSTFVPSSTSTSPSNPTFTTPSGHPLTIFLPSTASTPALAHASHSPPSSAYTPSLDQMRAHQAHLAARAQPQRLASDVELAAQDAARQDRLAQVESVTIVVRMPDGARVQGVFGAEETAGGLYACVRGLLSEEVREQPFELRYVDDHAKQVVLKEDGDGRKTMLVRGLGLRGRTLVSFVWGNDAGQVTRELPALKTEVREQGKDLVVRDVEGSEESEGKSERDDRKTTEAPAKEKKGKGDVESKMKKFLGLGKK
ncbi:MAG: hypothetical protein M1821_001064 [Bathelium mastoideum]|nr:MAG: hypothetical protein M1821_001064 [Bathelium mastoideum]